jgi:hypothetical protein
LHDGINRLYHADESELAKQLLNASLLGMGK